MAELVTRVVDIPSSRALGKDARTGLQTHAYSPNHGLQPKAPRCCNPLYPRLQPCVSAGAHICVNHGVSADLDALRTDSNPSPNPSPSLSLNPYPNPGP